MNSIPNGDLSPDEVESLVNAPCPHIKAMLADAPTAHDLTEIVFKHTRACSACAIMVANHFDPDGAPRGAA